MEEAISLDPNGKLTLKLRFVRGQAVAARTGWVDRQSAGQFLKIVDPHGKQAGDFWPFDAANRNEHLSAKHTRVRVKWLRTRSGESFQTDHRRPILMLVQDTCGARELLTVPCDEDRYKSYGVHGDHASCAGNFPQVMERYLGKAHFIRQPMNLVVNVGVFPDGRVETGDNPSKPGDCVVFKAWIDTLVALSACPQESNPVAGCYLTDPHIGIYEAA